MIRLTTKSYQGVSYDLTNHIEGLSWSSINPGGDETASFTFKRSWFAANPEVKRGNIVRITEGLDVLWQGRIEEIVRGADAVETIEVTAYGLGQRLKDNLYGPMPFVDRDFSRWGTINATRRSQILSLSHPVYDMDVAADPIGLAPVLRTLLVGSWGNIAHSFAQYDAGLGAKCGSVYYAFYVDTAVMTVADANWGWFINMTDTSIAGGTGNLRAASGSALYVPPSPGRFIQIEQIYSGAGAIEGQEYPVNWTSLVVYGNHGLTALSLGGGFSADQIIQAVLAGVSGITARRIESQSYEILQFVVDSPGPHEDVIAQADGFEANDWGTWGPTSPLDQSSTGYFDYRSKQLSTQHWRARRAELDSLDLATDISTLYNRVVVSWSDSAGTVSAITRTAVVPILDEQGLVRTAQLDAGLTTAAQASALGDSFLVLTGGFAPARGSVTVSKPITHYQRGRLPVQYLRADGSNIRIPDVLPSETMLAIDNSPDRRTTFPVKRVEVDASGEKVTASIELDQSNDLLSIIQARLSQPGKGRVTRT